MAHVRISRILPVEETSVTGEMGSVALNRCSRVVLAIWATRVQVQISYSCSARSVVAGIQKVGDVKVGVYVKLILQL